MSKRILAVCLLASLLAGSNAFASRARQVVMGSADPFGVIPHGTFYYDNNLNVLYNPAYVSDFKNWIAIEKFNGNGNASLTGAEGGFVASILNFNFGLYMNRGDAVTSSVAGANPYPTVTPVRPFDLLIGADMGFKWGLGFTYASNRQSDANNSNESTLRAGVAINNFEPFGRIKLSGSHKASGQGETKNSGWTLGTRYHWGEWVPFAAVNRDKVEPSNGALQGTSTSYGLGLGRNTKLAEGVSFNYAISYWRNIRKSVYAAAGNQNVLPIDLSAEAELTNWLSLFGGLSYRFWDRTNDMTNVSNVTGRFGSSIHVNKFAFEWAIGQAAAETTTTTAESGTVDTGTDARYFDVAHGFFTAASLTYKW